MTKEQCILVLDAAATICESCSLCEFKNLNAAVQLLQDALDEHFRSQAEEDIFGVFLKKQQEACRLLAESMVLFG